MYQYSRTAKDDKPVISGNYAIHCVATNRVYIGKAMDCWDRWEIHKKELNENKKAKKFPEFQADWNKYGEKQFNFHILNECSVSYYGSTHEKDTVNRIQELKYLIDIIPNRPVKLYNPANDRDSLMYKYIRFIIDVLGFDIIRIQRVLQGKNNDAGATKLDIVYKDDEGKLNCLDLHDPISDSTVYDKHSAYCDQKNIEFLNPYENKKKIFKFELKLDTSD